MFNGKLNFWQIISEILIIVIGVTISFSLNEYKEDQREHKMYVNYLKGLQADLKKDSLQMENDIRGFQSRASSAQRVLQADPGLPDSTLLKIVGGNLDRLLGWVVFLPNNNTFEILQSTGHFSVFPRDTIVQAAVQLYISDYNFIAQQNKNIEQLRSERLQEYVMEKAFLEDYAFSQRSPKTDPGEFLNNRYLRNCLVSYYFTSGRMVENYKEILERLKGLKRMVDKELASFK
jgi:hypothetical protein